MAKVKTTDYFYAPAKSSAKSKKLVNLLQVVAIALVIFVVLYLVILLPNQVDGQSMEPNFLDKELLFTDKIINLVGTSEFGRSIGYSYGRGDVVVFPEGDISLIKRIVAVGGDTIRIQNDKVYINDFELIEEYIPEDRPTRIPFSNYTFAEGETVIVPKGSFFLMGDNRTNSKDSRFADVGFVAQTELSGRVFFRYWPLDRLGIIGRGEAYLNQ